MPIRDPAAASRRVRARSSADGGAGDDGFLEHLARVDEARREAAHRDDGLPPEAVPGVEGEEAERLDRTRSVPREQVPGRLSRRLERRRARAGVGGEARPELERGEDTGRFRPPEPAHLLELEEGARRERAEAGAQEVLGHVQGGGPARPGAQQGGEELPARERPRAEEGEALAGSLVARQVLKAQELSSTRPGNTRC
jgi:hypothetical protein